MEDDVTFGTVEDMRAELEGTGSVPIPVFIKFETSSASVDFEPFAVTAKPIHRLPYLFRVAHQTAKKVHMVRAHSFALQLLSEEGLSAVEADKPLSEILPHLPNDGALFIVGVCDPSTAQASAPTLDSQ